MKVEAYAERAAAEIRNVAAHHDSPFGVVDGQLAMLADLITELRAGLNEARAAHAKKLEEAAVRESAERTARMAARLANK